MQNIRDSFNVFMPIDVAKSVEGIGGDDAPWVFEGIASTADVDLFGEVVYPESFHNSIEFFKSNGKIFFDHDYAKQHEDWLSNYGFSKDEILSLKTPLGKPLDAEIRPEGLYIKAMLNKRHPMARKMWEEFLTNPDAEFQSQIGLSIGAKYLGQPRREYDVKKGQYVTYLPDLLLYEVSMTPEPVNPNTKTWAAVLKSMMDEGEQAEADTQFHTIVPDETIYDAERNRLVIKSTVQGGDGITHVFESYVDLKEDIKNAMADNNTDTLKAASGDDDKEKKTAPVDNDAAPDKDEKAPDAGLSDEGAEQTAEVSKEGTDADDNTPGNQAAPDGVAPETPDAGLPEEESGMGDMGAADAEEGEGEGEAAPMGAEGAPSEGGEEGAGGVLDTLVGDDEGDEGEGDEDAANEMILDKLDTLLDYFQTIADALHVSGGEEPPMADQVSEEAPNVAATKSIDMDAIKSMIQESISGSLSSDTVITLSDDSTAQLGEALKSVFDGFEDRIVEKVVNKLYNETTVVKSTTSNGNNRADAAVVHPGVAVDGSQDTSENIPTVVRKSIGTTGEESDEDILSASEVDTLKSLVGNYRNIIGNTTTQHQQRGKVVEQAEKLLGMKPHVFNHYVKMADRGKF